MTDRLVLRVAKRSAARRYNVSSELTVSEGSSGDNPATVDAVPFPTRSQPPRRRPHRRRRRRGIRTFPSVMIVLQLTLLLVALVVVQHVRADADAGADDIFIHDARPHQDASSEIESQYRHHFTPPIADAASALLNNEINPAQRIIGGTPTSATRYPYMASLQKTYLSGEGVTYFAHVCGGTLIAPDLVLTAAHCFDCSSAKCYDRVALGRHDFRSFAENTYVSSVENNGGDGGVGAASSSTAYDGRLVFDIDEIEEIKHPGYKYNLYTSDIGNDYGLIKLPDRANSLTATGAPLNYIRVNRNPNVPARNGAQLTVAGWGALSIPTPQSNNLSPVLMDTTVAYVNNGRCTQSGGYVEGTYYSYWNFVKSSMMCALTPGQDACVGDSGGPILLRGAEADGSGDVQLGIVSFGVGCANPDFPGIYARLSDQYDWLRDSVCELSQYPPEDYVCYPTPNPTVAPSVAPTFSPSAGPSPSPTFSPTTVSPTSSPSASPATAAPVATGTATGPSEAPTLELVTGSYQNTTVPAGNATILVPNRVDADNSTSNLTASNPTTTAAPTASRQGGNPRPPEVTDAPTFNSSNGTGAVSSAIPTFQPTVLSNNSAPAADANSTSGSTASQNSTADPASLETNSSASTQSARPSMQPVAQPATNETGSEPPTMPSAAPSEQSNQSASSEPSAPESASPTESPSETLATSSSLALLNSRTTFPLFAAVVLFLL